MSYLVLARKWRPKTFGDVTGQEHVVRTLANAIAQDRVVHAYLFCGPRGVGKTTAARLLAGALNCVKGPTAEPCGTCAPCVEIADASNIDVLEIDGASNNSVDDVRQIRERVMYLPHRDRHKIYIIDEVHMLSGSAFNALLKTLEEPPPHVKFIFATTDPQKLPDTILSRCQRHNFRRISEAAMVKRMRQVCDAEGFRVSDRALSLVARQADGGMRDAFSLLDQIFATYGTTPSDTEVAEALGTVDRTVVHALCVALVRRDPRAFLSLVADAYDKGVEMRRLCDEAALYLRHLVVTRVAGSAPDELADVERMAVVELAGEAEVAQLARLFDVVHGSAHEVGRAPQPRLALEVALLKAVHLAPSASLPDLVARVEELSRSLGTPPDRDRAAPGGRPAAAPFRAEGLTASEAAAPYGAEGTAPAVAAGSVHPSPSVAALPPGTRERNLAVDTSPEGCATQECFAPAAGESGPRDADRWKAAIDAVAAKRARVAASLAHGRLLRLVPGEAAITFAPEAGFHRTQVQRARPDIEAALAAHFGGAVRLVVEESAAASAAPSPAEEAASAEAERLAKRTRHAREQPAVLAAVRVLGGSVEDVRILDPAAEGSDEPA